MSLISLIQDLKNKGKMPAGTVINYPHYIHTIIKK